MKINRATTEKDTAVYGSTISSDILSITNWSLDWFSRNIFGFVDLFASDIPNALN